jgi:hypothetical protein
VTAHVHVGPARVLGVEPDGRPRVLVLGGSCEVAIADWAIPFRYQPTSGDTLLVIGQRSRYAVPGVTHGSGRSHLAFRGDAALRAAGTMRLGGDGGVRIAAPEIRVTAGDLECTAETVVQRLGDADATVPGCLDERLGQSERIIDEHDERVAARHETVAARVVRIDGDLLRLG